MSTCELAVLVLEIVKTLYPESWNLRLGTDFSLSRIWGFKNFLFSLSLISEYSWVTNYLQPRKPAPPPLRAGNIHTTTGRSPGVHVPFVLLRLDGPSGRRTAARAAGGAVLP